MTKEDIIDKYEEKKRAMKFTVKNKETGDIVIPRNYYFVIKQNGELYTFNGVGKFEKADDKYGIIVHYVEVDDSCTNKFSEM